MASAAPFGIVGSLVQRTQRERKRIVDQHLRNHARLEKRNNAALLTFFRAVSADIVKRLGELGPAPAESLVPAGKYAAAFEAAQRPWWLRAIASGAQSEAELIQQVRADDERQKTAAETVGEIFIDLPATQQDAIRAWVKYRQVGIWSKIEGTLQKKLRAELTEAIRLGVPMDQLQKRIQNILPGLNKTAARRIARTETNGAMNFGHNVMRHKEGVTEKEWISTFDQRTRTGKFNHMMPNGQKRPQGQPFDVSGQQLMHPGDIMLGATAGNVINCRCTSAASIDAILKPRKMLPVGPAAPKKKPQPKPAEKPAEKPKPAAPVTPAPKKPAEPPKPVPPPQPPKPAEQPKPVVPVAPPQPEPPKPPPKPEPKPKKKRVPAFPKDADQLEVIGQLGGSTGAELVQDEWGRKWVRKRGNSPEHVREEFLAEELYRKMKVPVPTSKLYDGTRGPVKLSRFIEDATPLGKLTGDAKKKAITKARQHFAADALMADWDVVGLDADNLLVDKAGKVWRIDVGASLRYRAQGGLKGEAFNGGLTEFWTLTEQGSAAQVFQGMDFKARLKSAGRVVKALDDWKARQAFLELPGKIPGLQGAAELEGLLAERLNLLRTIHRGGEEFLADGWKAGYVDRLMRHVEGLTRAGYVKKLPLSMTQKRGSVEVFDDMGVAFDHLRSADPAKSSQQTLVDYVGSIGGDWRAVELWAGEQASDSWYNKPQAVKWWLMQHHKLGTRGTFWKGGIANAKRQAERFMTAEAVKAFESQHASTWLMMDSIVWDTRSVDDVKRVVKLMRTENRDMLAKTYGIDWREKRGEWVKFARGAVESFSPFVSKSVHGTIVTYQEVPYTRVLGTYLPGRGYGNSSSFFYGDHENEFTTFAGDVPVKVIGDYYTDNASSWTP